ncbi:MAG: ABC transporter permease, partial [Actinobacteria bacterium]|nr:ABC transporter permease [Actinomycetota bacterium]
MNTAASSLPTRSRDWSPLAAVRRLELSPAAWIGLGVAILVVLIGLFGPYFAPHDPAEFVGKPLSPPSSEYPLGLDYLGRDALSRFLCGGRTAILLAVAGFVLGAAIGLTLGLLAAYSRGPLDRLIDRGTEILVGFPSLVMMMLLVAGLGTGEFWVIVVALAVVNFPRVARIVRAAGVDVRDMAYVEVAEARGEGRLYLMFRELLPGVMPSFLVDAGMRIP